MNMGKVIAGISVAIAATLFFSIFIVKEVNQAIVLQFGDPKTKLKLMQTMSYQELVVKLQRYCKLLKHIKKRLSQKQKVKQVDF